MVGGEDGGGKFVQSREAKKSTWSFTILRYLRVTCHGRGCPVSHLSLERLSSYRSEERMRTTPLAPTAQECPPATADVSPV